MSAGHEKTGGGSGGCLCGAVRYAVSGGLRPVVFCHCGQCRRAHGHFGAYSAARRADVAIVGEDALAWFESSPGVRRGFCRRCGSKLFWDVAARGSISISAGSLDAPSGLKSSAHIFVADKGGYYGIGDGLPQHPGGLHPAGLP
ncbi:MAG: GFA family protein [Kiloniellales bacterium]